MVRRWSCVNNINTNLNFSTSSYFLQKRYKFINFKSSVSLKRFNKKYTKFKRKAFNRIKHINNWAIYHNVFNSWSKNYYLQKKLNKAQYLNFMFLNNYTFYNFISLRNKIDLAETLPFSFYNNTKFQNKHLGYFNLYNVFQNRNFDYTKKLQKFFGNSNVQTEEPLIETNSTNIFLLKEHDKIFFQTSLTLEHKNTFISKIDINFISKIIFLKLKLIFFYYKLLIDIILLNILLNVN